jgi:hypothetical protein
LQSIDDALGSAPRLYLNRIGSHKRLLGSSPKAVEEKSHIPRSGLNGT